MGVLEIDGYRFMGVIELQTGILEKWKSVTFCVHSYLLQPVCPPDGRAVKFWFESECEFDQLHEAGHLR